MEYRNARRSRKLIRTAFIELMNEKKDIEKITVKEIVERADISKSTFYAHYKDIYGVVEEFEKEIIQAQDEAINAYIAVHSDDFMPYVNKFLMTINENENIYRTLIKSNLSKRFIDKLKESFVNNVLNDKYLQTKVKNLESRMFQIYLTSNAIIYTIVDYLSGKLEISIEELTIKFNNYLKDIKEYVKNNYQ